MKVPTAELEKAFQSLRAVARENGHTVRKFLLKPKPDTFEGCHALRIEAHIENGGLYVGLLTVPIAVFEYELA